MPKGIMVVFSNPTSPEQDAEYNTWYDDVHLKEVLGVPGVVSGTRYRLAADANPMGETHPYLAVYEFDGDPATILATLGSTMAPPSPALDAAGAHMTFWVEKDES